ncbi:MAG: response regulator, partial [Bacteroidota bacterium]|nr:response regulator [Bacteroidota bacterium]
MITCIAVDDEPSALDVIAIHAAKMQELEVLGLYADPFKARDFLKNNPVDLIFLDINMPGLSGLQLLDQLSVRPHVIFATA